MKRSFKLFALIATVLFVVAAGVQYNDPDGALWIFIYGVAALLFFTAVIGRLHFSFALLLSLLYVVVGIALWPEKWEGISTDQGNISNIERARESLGMILTGLIVMIIAIWKRLSPQNL